MVPKSDTIKPVLTSFINAITIGDSKTTSIIRRDNNPNPITMYLKGLIEQQHHQIIQQQMRFFYHRFNPPQILGNGLNLLPVINVNCIPNRNILYPKYAGRVIAELCNTENRFWVQNGLQRKKQKFRNVV